MLKCIGMQNLIKILMYQVVQELSAVDHDMSDLSSSKPCHRFAYQCLDNVKMYAKYDHNILCGSRVIIFTKIRRPAKVMLGKASSPFCIQVAGQC